jgi:hypothetical protein
MVVFFSPIVWATLSSFCTTSSSRETTVLFITVVSRLGLKDAFH